MRLNVTDLDVIGNCKAHTHRNGGTFVAVLEDGKVAIVQGYARALVANKDKTSIRHCLATCIKVRDLAGLAKAHYGQFPDA